MASDRFSVLEGDFVIGKNRGHVVGKHLVLGVPGRLFPLKVRMSKVASVEVLNVGTAKAFGGAVGAGLAGGLLLGGVGAVAGLLAGGNRQTAAFRIRLDDGRQLVGAGDSSVLARIQSARLKPSSRAGWAVPLLLLALTGAALSLAPKESRNDAARTRRQASARAPTAAPRTPPEGPAAGITLPGDLSYRILETPRVPTSKRSLDVLLSRRVTRETLESVSRRLQQAARGKYDLTLIGYLLDERDRGRSYYATARFDPELAVEFLGHERDAPALVPPKAGGVLVGR